MKRRRLVALVAVCFVAALIVWSLRDRAERAAPGDAPAPIVAAHDSTGSRATAPGADAPRSTSPAGAASTKPLAPLRGRLVSARTHEPVVPGEITMQGLDRFQMTASDLPDAGARVVAVQSDGRFEIDRVPPGRYSLEALAPGYAHETRLVQAPSAKEIVFTMRDAAFLAGFVVHKDSSPAPGASVTASSPSGSASGETGPSGAFSLEVAPGMQTVVARSGKLTARTEAPLEVRPGQTRGELRLVLQAGVRLIGRVVDPNDAPIAGAQARLALITSFHASPFGEITTGADGAFAFEGVPRGVAEVSAWAPGAIAAEQRVFVGDADVSVVLHLGRPAAIDGFVFDTHHAPVRDALVSVAGAQANVDERGAYAVQDLPPGQATVSAKRPGAATGASREVKLVSGETAHVDLTLADSARLHGIVRWKSGRAVDEPARITVTGSGNSHDTYGGADSDAQGAYSFELAPGDYQVSARMAGWVNGFNPMNGAPLSLQAGDDRELDLTLPQESAEEGIHGLVLEPGGAPSNKPVIAETISVQQPDGSMQETTRNFRAREDGTFDAPLYTQGDGSARFFARNGGRTGTATADARSNHPIILLQPAAALAGSLEGDCGGTGTVTLTITHPGAPLAFLDQPVELSGATFILDDIAPGNIELSARRGNCTRSQQLLLEPGKLLRTTLPFDAPHERRRTN